MKKWISLLFAAALMLCLNVAWTSAAAQKSTETVPKLYLDGKELEAAVPPKLVDSSVLVPIRTVAENLGYKVGWDGKKKQITVEEGSTQVSMTLGVSKATVNGKTVSLAAPPVVQSDTALIPIRFVGETFGLQILWDNTSKAAFLYTDATAETGGTDGEASGNPDGTADSDAGLGSGEGSGPQPGTNPGNGTGSVPEPGSGTGGNGQAGNVEGEDGGGTSGTQNPENPDGSQTGGQQGGSADPAPKVPAEIHQIRYEPNALVLTYGGTVTPTAHTLKDPDRIVVDLAHAVFAGDFTSGFASGIVPDYFPDKKSAPAPGQIAEMIVNGDPLVTKIRYSRYSDNPSTIRIVLDLNQASNYELIHDAGKGEIRIRLQKASVSVPAPDSYTVVLDAGHGGSDPGAKSVTGRWEKEFNLSVVKKVQAILSKEGKISLVLTREGDTYPTLDDRINLANSLNADLFVSVHANSYKPEINGTETYYNRQESRAFADLLHKNAVAATRFKDNGVRTANFKVIKYTTMPAVLLEVGYLSNAANEKELFKDEFQDRVAEAIALSIKQYFNLS